jgi:diguanylate cyclase (GGDEF)-like protein
MTEARLMTKFAQIRAIKSMLCAAPRRLLRDKPAPAPARVLSPGRTRAEGDRYDGGWLCPTEADRIRLTDMSPAVRRARLLAGLFCGVGVVALEPWLGWWPVVVFALVPAPLLVLDRLLSRALRPERFVAASLLLHTTLIVAGVGLSGGVGSPLLPWVAIPVVTAAARFRLPVFLTGALLAAVAVVLAAVLASSSAPINDPAPLIGVIVLLGALVVAQRPLLDAETRWRRDAVLDPLTGLLNRQGLQRRFREVAEQARLADQPVSLVAFDLDEFKHINDAHGHAQGDAVLTEVADALRKGLRSFELLYRIGGEELLLILPGTDLSVGCEIAERARCLIEQGEPAGLRVTASFGVSTAVGDAIEFAPMFEAADRSLYAAKRAGRNLVACLFRASDEPAVLTRGRQAIAA